MSSGEAFVYHFAVIDKLESVSARLRELDLAIEDPGLTRDPARYREVMRERSRLSAIDEAYAAFKTTLAALEDAKTILREESDQDMREMAREEQRCLELSREEQESRLRELLVPRDPLADKSVIMEIRAGTGGEEAALFASDLYRMYSRYAETQGWKVEIMSTNPTELGGLKEIIFVVDGRGAYSKFKYESGVHRVQRVPITEAGGRIHTSTVTVAVLPEADDVEVNIDPEELRIDVYRSTGHGGQSVNTTDSAVRITHLPTGMVVTCQDEKSQHKNKAKALRILRSRLLEIEQKKQKAEIDRNRKSQIGSGERSERIRTYNYPQNRVTDHRINLTLYRLESILEGDLDEVVESLATEERARMLEKVG